MFESYWCGGMEEITEDRLELVQIPFHSKVMAY